MKYARFILAATVAVSMASIAKAEKKYGPGVTDTEIKIGNIMPYSGPASAYGIIGQTEAAYFKKINDEGGINGRKINWTFLKTSPFPVISDSILPMGSEMNRCALSPVFSMSMIA